MIIPKDVIILPDNKDFFIVINVFTKTSLGVDINSLRVFQKLSKFSKESIISKNQKINFSIYNTHIFSNYEGLMADPSRLQKLKREKKIVDIKQLINEFEEKSLCVKDVKKYRNKFQLKNSLLDYEHLGNFHQQLGQFLMIEKREDPNTWWLNQKFNIEKYELKKNLYYAIQGKFLETYFKKKIKPTDKILDVGCGPGYYTNFIGKIGAEVLGIDPNLEFIKIAKQNASKNSTFKVVDIGKSGALDFISKNSYDYVFMSDALLFYFVPFDNKKLNVEILLSDLKQILKREGIFINLEPHYIFWLLPWYGEIDNPFTIISEYHEKKFGVTPTLSKLIQTYRKGGFTVQWMEELFPSKDFKKIDPKAYNFAKKFPLWHLFELKPI